MSKLAIGTANFGMEYGFSDSRRKLNAQIVGELLDYAWLNGIDTIDTAKGYGESESVIGNYLKDNEEKQFNIITKLNKNDAVDLDFTQSLANLQKEKIYGVLIHHFKHLKNKNSILPHLLRFKEKGICDKVGVSLYYPEELQYLIDNNIPIDMIQIAYSLFDRRFEKFFPILKEMNIEINVRSVYLQGLFFADTTKLGSHFDKVKQKIKAIQKLSKTNGLSVASLCLNFVSNNDYIDKIVIGADSLGNLKSSVQVLTEKEKILQYLESFDDLSVEDVNILFPHFWKL